MKWNDIKKEQPKNNDICLVTDGKDIYVSKYQTSPIGLWVYPTDDHDGSNYCMFINNKITHWLLIPGLP